MRKEFYFSVDIEADGPIPGPYSMCSFGIVAVGERNDDRLVRYDIDDEKNCFYRELTPISENFVPDALEASQFTRDYLTQNGVSPVDAMFEAKNFINSFGNGPKIMLASPVGFDFMFMHWYFINFTQVDPFGFSGHLDLRSYYAGVTGRSAALSSKRFIPSRMRSGLPHTHNALDDAKEQGVTFLNVMSETHNL